VRRFVPLLALLALAGCGGSGGGGSTTDEDDAIAIDSPTRDKAVHSPFHVTGTANTFEASFTLELRTGGGVLVHRTVTATSGSGTRGSFDVQLHFSVAEETRGTLRAYEVSAANGEPVNEVTVALSLVP
jgi:germination protein M